MYLLKHLYEKYFEETRFSTVLGFPCSAICGGGDGRERLLPIVVDTGKLRPEEEPFSGFFR